MLLKINAFICCLFLMCSGLFAQEDDLLSMLDEEERTDYITAAFKTNRIINLHSIEHTSKGVLDIKISHRFGFLNGGFYDLFGLDNAEIRIGGDYGVTDRLQIGIGRSSFQKTYDGYFKYKILRQSKGKKTMPITLSFFASTAIQTLKWQNPDRDNKFSSRLYYTFQGLIGRKFSDNFSLQLSPTLVHRNLVETSEQYNDVFALGIGLRQKISSRVSINAEYIYVPQDVLLDQYQNALSVGVDIETGGHVFQLHFTNSTSMIEKGFVAENTGDWTDGGVHFGFNVSRVFTLVKPKFE